MTSFGVTSHDLQGRPYARLSQLKPGDLVVTDDGFTCLPPWSTRTVKAWTDKTTHETRLYIRCTGDEEEKKSNRPNQQHFLDGQLDARSDHLIGIYRKEDFHK